MFTHAQLLVIADALNDRAEQIEDQVNSDVALDPRDVAYLRTSIDELIDALTAVRRELDK
jgi:hypothetical protein